jgi:hypothetical protein
MQDAKDAKARMYPWIKPFMREMKDEVIPILMGYHKDHNMVIGDRHSVKPDAVKDAIQEWAENPHTHERGYVPRSDPDTDDDEPLGRGFALAGQGLSLAGQTGNGLKLAGQGMFKSMSNKLYGLARHHEGPVPSTFARTAIGDLVKSMHRHAKKFGRHHIIHDIAPHIAARLHHHINAPDEAHMSGGSFWGKIWNGLKTAWKVGKKIGGPLLDAASFVVPAVAPELAPALAAAQTVRKFANKPTLSGAKGLYEGFSKRK